MAVSERSDLPTALAATVDSARVGDGASFAHDRSERITGALDRAVAGSFESAQVRPDEAPHEAREYGAWPVPNAPEPSSLGRGSCANDVT